MFVVMSSSLAAMAGSILAADLVSGLVHWAEDTYARFKPRRKLRWLNLIARDNQVHHRRPRDFLERNWWQSSWDLLLAGALVQTPRHHGRHHSGRRDTHYCVVTNFLNPLLEEVDFWRRLERAIGRITGLAPTASRRRS